MTNGETLATGQQQNKYLPNVARAGIGLSLSGGGFRASLFHLGALRRLWELGIVDRIRTISSVSGGSIMSGFLAYTLSRKAGEPVQDWEKEVSKPFRDFCKHNIRLKPILEGLLPWKKNSELLAGKYEALLTPGMPLSQLPLKPAFKFCATDLSYGANWTFTKDHCGDYRAGYVDPGPLGWKVSKAVAASSCFPPVFKPLSLHLSPDQLKDGMEPDGPARTACIRGMTFTDGGVYDNLGLEPIWKDHEVVFASDGGALFGFGGDSSFFWEVKRYLAIPENQALALRKRWLIASFINGAMQGTYWGIGSSPQSYGVAGGYPKDLASTVIAGIRTDLDAFSDAEAFVLENHGYTLADAAMEVYVNKLLPSPVPPAKVPHPDWMDPQKVRAALKDSGKRKLFGRT